MVLSFLHCLHAVCKQPSWQLCMRHFITMGETQAQLCGGVLGFTKFWKLRSFRQLCKPMLMLNIIIIIKITEIKSTEIVSWSFFLERAFQTNVQDPPQHHYYPYTTETQKATKVSNKSLFFNWVHSLCTEWTPLILLIYSQIHVTIFPPMAKLLYTLI